MKPSIIHISSFGKQEQRHGGVKRSLQLCEVAKSKGAITIQVPISNRETLKYVASSPISIAAILPIALVLGFRFLSLRGFATTLCYGAWLHAILKHTRATEVMLEVSPNRDIILGNVLSSLRTPFSAYPHNIEFMVPGNHQYYFRSHGAAFSAELRVYRSARSVFSISNLDAATLRALGVESVDTLPYSPPPSDAATLLQVRKERERNAKAGILLLGSAENPPTRMGLVRILEIIEGQHDGRRFVLAGFGTEALSSIAPSCVEVLGRVSNQALFDLMVRTQALLIFQPPTSGMLTRIVEAARAGIPTYVMGGYLQAHELPNRGIYSISDLSKLPTSSGPNNSLGNDFVS